MAVKRVFYAGETLIDLSGDTVTPETLDEGITAHDKTGEPITGKRAKGDSAAMFRRVKLPPVEQYGAVGYANGKYIAHANSGMAAYSEDGINWMQAEKLPTNNLARAFAYGNGVYVVAHMGCMLYSEDGITWAEGTTPVFGSWNSLAYGNGRFVAGSMDGYTIYSDDGKNWTQVGSQFSYLGSNHKLAYGDGKFVTVINSMGFSSTYSTDGISWGWDHTVNGEFSGGASAICYGGDKFVVLSTHDQALYSYDGINWEMTTVPVEALYNSVTYGNGVYIGICQGSVDDDLLDNADVKTAIYSTDGINWQEIMLPTAQKWVDVCYGDNGFVAISVQGEVAYSVDGIEWESYDLPVTAIMAFAVTHGDGKFVSVSPSYVAYSTDGVSWRMTNTSVSDLINQVCYGNGIFVAVGSETVMYSSNGKWWTNINMRAQWMSQMALAFCNGKFFAGFKNPANALYYSVDGINWEFTMGAVQFVAAICYGEGKYVEISYAESYDAHGTAKAGYSTDGMNWTETTMPFSQEWSALCYGKGKFVAVAENSNLGAYSRDGVEWAGMELPSTQAWKSVSYGNGVFVAVAKKTDVAAYSFDGINWTETSVLFSSATWVSICYGDGKFVAVDGHSGACSVCDVTKPLK